MNDMTAYCGINCATCPLYKATVSGDDALKRQVAEEWGSMYKRTFHISEMECSGCKSEKVFIMCSKCDIKACNKNKESETCRRCSGYPCVRIQVFYKWQEEHNTEIEIIK